MSDRLRTRACKSRSPSAGQTQPERLVVSLPPGLAGQKPGSVAQFFACLPGQRRRQSEFHLGIELDSNCGRAVLRAQVEKPRLILRQDLGERAQIPALVRATAASSKNLSKHSSRASMGIHLDLEQRAVACQFIIKVTRQHDQILFAQLQRENRSARKSGQFDPHRRHVFH